MNIQGCAYEGLSKEEDKFFTAMDAFQCKNCGLLQDHIGLAVFAGHLCTDLYTADILVWTKPIECLRCGFTIRDVLSPCGEYVLDLGNVLLPYAS